ncbi:hypothetical protein ENUP19_0128G0017 [Entamoeba nuttalli]|uniref:PRA1 family protein n=1 Tax=Entamoeba nuttalli TaxID=412467 RepID=A0ABQ0DJK6_9EUKA
MEQLVKTINSQINALMSGSYKYDFDNVIKRLRKSLMKFYPTYIVVYYYSMLVSTIFFKSLYPCVLATFIVVVLGMFLLSMNIKLSISSTTYRFNGTSYFICCIIIPGIISLFVGCLAAFIISALLSLTTIFFHSITYTKPSPIKIVVD